MMPSRWDPRVPAPRGDRVGVKRAATRRGGACSARDPGSDTLSANPTVHLLATIRVREQEESCVGRVSDKIEADNLLFPVQRGSRGLQAAPLLERGSLDCRMCSHVLSLPPTDSDVSPRVSVASCFLGILRHHSCRRCICIFILLTLSPPTVQRERERNERERFARRRGGG